MVPLEGVAAPAIPANTESKPPRTQRADTVFFMVLLTSSKFETTGSSRDPACALRNAMGQAMKYLGRRYGGRSEPALSEGARRPLKRLRGRGLLNSPGNGGAVAGRACARREFRLLPDHFDQHPFPAPAVELAVEDLLPRPEVESSRRHRHHHLAAHDLALEMRVRVVLAGLVVTVLRGRRMRRQALEPALVVRVQAALVVVDEDAG